MNAEDPLHGSFRRLLWAYPNWYRRERGQEMLTTLLDAATQAQRRPTGRDIADILIQGMRCRLRPPRGPAYLIVAVVAAAFAAVTAAAAVGGQAMASLGTAPSEQETISVAETAIGHSPYNVPGPPVRCVDYCLNTWLRGGDEVMAFDTPLHRNRGVDQTMVVYWEAPLSRAATLDRARQRLAAAGWTIAAEPYPPEALGNGPFGPPFQGFTAYRHHQAVHIHRVASDGVMPPMYLILEPHPPAAPVLATSAGAAAGGFLTGWLTICWALQRHRRHTTGLQTAIIVLGWPLISVMTLILLLTLAYAVAAAIATTSMTIVALVPAVAMYSLSLGIPDMLHLTEIISVGTGLIVTLASLPTRRRPQPSPTDQLARKLTG
jgi:hypothetical protein